MLGTGTLGAVTDDRLEEETAVQRVFEPVFETAIVSTKDRSNKEQLLSSSVVISPEQETVAPYSPLVLEPLPLQHDFSAESLTAVGSASTAFHCPLSCEWSGCSETFATQRDLVLHANDHIASLNWAAKTNIDSLLTCRWRDCWNPHPFSYQMRMVEHMRAHTLEKPYMVRLPSCFFHR